MLLKVVLCFIAFFHSLQCAKILVIIPAASYSHQIAFFELWRKLSLKGHQITLATTDPIDDPKLVNITEIDLSPSYRHVSIVSNLFQTQTNPWNCLSALRTLLKDSITYTLSHPQLQELKQGKEKYDLVIAEHIMPEFLIFGRIYNCPTILIASSEIEQVYNQAAGNPTHPISHPHFHLPYHGALSFWERLLSSVHYLYIWYFFKFVNFPFYNENLRYYFNTSVAIEELLSSVDLFFVNSHPVIHGARALSPTTLLINYQRGFSELRKNSRMNNDLQEFMDKANDGFIYFSLGSNLKGSQLKKELFDTILDVMRELKFPILYKFEEDDLPGKPDNVKIIKWAPQTQILNHHNIRLFITHGGSQSTEEAVYAAVPMVVIPFFFDQAHNGNALKTRGVAQVVQQPLKKKELIEAIKEGLSNPRYKEAATRLKTLALDVPINGLELTIWWIEYAIRNKGTKQLRNPAVDLPWYQFFLLDVVGTLILGFTATLSLVYYLATWLLQKYKAYGKSKEKLD